MTLIGLEPLFASTAHGRIFHAVLWPANLQLPSSRYCFAGWPKGGRRRLSKSNFAVPLRRDKQIISNAEAVQRSILVSRVAGGRRSCRERANGSRQYSRRLPALQPEARA